MLPITSETTSELRDVIREFKLSSRITESTTNHKRVYVTPNGDKYPSVTTVLSALSDKTHLNAWKSRVGEKEANKITSSAASRGTSMHHLIEKLFEGNELSNEDKISQGYPYYRKISPFLRKIEPLGVEVPLWSDRLKIAGRTDCIGIHDGNLCIIDFKTSRKEKKVEWITNYFHQSTFYAMMLFERLNLHAKNMVILISPEEGITQEFKRPIGPYIPECISLATKYHSLNKSF